MLIAFLIVLAFMSAVMTAAWLFQRAVNNAGWVDVFWTFGTGAACVLTALWPGQALSERQFLVTALGSLWAVRLGSYVAWRVRWGSQSGAEDVRYARARQLWGDKFQSRMFALVIAQAPATALLTLSTFASAHTAHQDFGFRDGLGAALMIFAILGEALADEQMRAYKRAAPTGGIMDKGLWAVSRHPNYFFEWFGWLAYPVIGLNTDQPLSYLTLVAPALMYLILRFATGVPALEAAMLETRGDAFRAYQRRVSAFFPLPPRRPA